jgi:hypothetical protein
MAAKTAHETQSAQEAHADQEAQKNKPAAEDQ